MAEEAQNMEKVVKALKIVIMDLKKKVEGFSEEFEGLKTDLKTQDGEIKAISKMVNKAMEFAEGGTGVVTAPSEPMDIEKLNQLETKLDNLETKVLATRGKVSEIEDALTTVKRPASEVPSPELTEILARLDTLEQTVSDVGSIKESTQIDLNPISRRLEVVENTISRLETTRVSPDMDLSMIVTRLESLEASAQRAPAEAPQPREPAPAGFPEPEPLSEPAAPATTIPPSEFPTTERAPTTGALTMKDKVITVIEELVSASAMKIAMKLQVSTASIMGILRNLESEGRVTLSGDVDSNPDIKLA